MIYDYKIKNNNGNEILYLYFDFDDNFAKNKINKRNIKEYILKFIKDNDIVYKGTVIMIVIGGIVAGSLNIDNNYNKNINDNIKIASIINVDKERESIINNEKEDIKEEKSNKIVIEKNNVSKVITTNKVTVKNNNKQKAINNKKEENNQEKTNNISSNIDTKTNNKEEVVDNNVYVKVKMRDGNIVTKELEEYLIGVVGAEMPASFNIEALKAQAVVSRTYALNAIKTNKLLTTTSSTQNYKTNEELKSLWGGNYNTYYNKIKNAVYSTKGEYITYNGEIIDAVFHSTSNGQTENAQYVWGNSKPYLISVESPYDTSNSSFLKEKFFTYEELSLKLSLEINFLTEFNIIDKTAGNRINNIDISDKRLSGVEIRKILGLRSADFDIIKQDTGILFVTRGYGHGVGMSQYGANGYAKNGFSYKDIIKHYYTGVSINHL